MIRKKLKARIKPPKAYIERIGFTRLTNGFSKKLENHSHSLAVYFFHHNFCRIHKGLRVTPAMAAGVTDELMEMGHLVRLIDLMEEPPKPRGPYKKKAILA